MRIRSGVSRRRNGRLGLETIFTLSTLFAAGILFSYNYHFVSQSSNRGDDVDQKQHQTNYVKDEMSSRQRVFLRDKEQGEFHNENTIIQRISGRSNPLSSTSDAALDSSKSDDGALDPTTIPSFFTPITEQHLHNGRVVQELSRRVLSRNIAQSNVVVMSPGFGGASSKDNTLYPAKLAVEQGHSTHLLPATTNLSLGWNNQTDTSSVTQKHYNSTSVSWILLAYFSTFAESQNNDIVSIDDVLSPSKAGAWLKQTTITYLVFPIRAKATLSYSSIFLDEKFLHRYEYHRDYLNGATLSFTGLTAAQTLLDQNFKLQLLASSHHFDAAPIRVNNDGWDKEGESTFDYGPNALFMSTKALHRYLYQRVVEVLEQEVNNILDYYPRKKHQPSEKIYVKHQYNQTLEVEIHSLIFATQGLDLAIPARSSYTDVGQHKSCIEVSGTHRRKTRCDPKLNARALNDTIFLSCPSRHSAVQVRFGSNPGVIDRTSLEKRHGIFINIHDSWLKEPDEKSGEMEVWTSAKSPEGIPLPGASEAICVKTNKNAILPSVACTTRIIPNYEMLTSVKDMAPSNNTAEFASKNDRDERTNLLFIMIDPLSRLQLKRSLPNTWALLELLGFVDFVHYTAVGNNSGPNQAALYSGMKLDGGRQGIKGSDTRLWIWDRLKKAGYMTMKVEDGCVR